jgi:hypothetical protein
MAATHDLPPKPALETFIALPDTELLARYRRGVENFDRRMFDLSPEQLDAAFLPEAGVGRWPVRVLLGHLADAELAFVHRMRRTAAEDNPMHSAWDEDAFIDSGLYGTQGTDGRHTGPLHPIAGYVAVIHTLRRWHADWLATLTPQQWQRKCLHAVRGEQTLRIICNYATWHLEHHAWFLKAKLDKMLPTAPAHAHQPHARPLTT